MDRYTEDFALLSNWNNAGKAAFCALRNQSLSNKIGKLDPSSKPFWNKPKLLRKRSAWFSLIAVNDEVLVSDADKCEAFNDHFVASHIICANLVAADRCCEINRMVACFLNSDLAPSSESALSDTVIRYSMKCKESRDLDKVRNFFPAPT